MTHFNATLLSSDIPLSIVHIEHIEAYVTQENIGLKGNPSWIAPHVAARISLQNMPSMEQVRAMRSLLAPARIDIIFTPANAPKIKLFLADMDSTMVTTETLDEMAGKVGIKDKIATITARSMNGDLDFHTALIERVGLLKNLPIGALKETLDETILCEGAKELVQHLRDGGATCVLVSGGFTYFTSAVAAQCGFHHHHGNILNHDGAVLDGTVGMPILDKDSKLDFLKSYAANLNIGLDETMAIGDGANDLPMLIGAGLGIGYRPKPVVEDAIPNVLKWASHESLVLALNI